MRKFGENPPAGGDPPGTGRTFTGSLLVAHPRLRDANFRRSVLYLCSHSLETGTLGVILNRPLGTTAAELLPQHARREMLSRVPVYHGGPVGQDQLSFVEFCWTATSQPEEGEDVRLRSHLSLEEVEDLLAEAPTNSLGATGKQLRAVVGYAGWSGGQLEDEMRQNSWLLVKPSAQVFARPASYRDEKLWFHIFSHLGPAYKLLAAAPDDPSLN